MKLFQCAILKYGSHVGSMIMSDDRGNTLAGYDDLTTSLNHRSLYYLYYRWSYYYGYGPFLFLQNCFGCISTLLRFTLRLYWMKVIRPVYPDHCLMIRERCHFQPCLNGTSSGLPHNYILYLDPSSVCQSFFQTPQYLEPPQYNLGGCSTHW